MNKNNKFYKITSRDKEYGIKEFISKFDCVKNIKEVVVDKIYIFEIEDSDSAKNMKEMLSKHVEKISTKLIASRCTKENVILDYQPCMIKLDSYELTAKEIDKEIILLEYDNEKLAQHELCLQDDIEEKIMNSMKEAMKLIFAGITDEQATAFLKNASEMVYAFNRKATHTMGIGSEISLYQILPVDFIFSDKNNNDLMMKKLHVHSALNDLIREIEKEKEEYRKSCDNKLMNRILNQSMEVAGIPFLIMKNLDKWENAYDSSNEEMEKEIEYDLEDIIKNCNVPNLSGFTSRKPFEFFNYYNIVNYEKSAGFAFVKEVFNSFAPIVMVQKREKIYSYMDKLMKKGEDLSFDEVMLEINVDDISYENYLNHEVVKRNKLKMK